MFLRKLRRASGVKPMDEESISVDKLAEVLKKVAGAQEKEKTPLDRAQEMEVMDQMEARRRSRERQERQEQEEQGGGGGMGFKPREMMDMMMMQTFMERMGGSGGGSDLAEIMKWKAIAGNGMDGDLDKVIQVLREEANTQRERQDQMMAQMYGEKKAAEFRDLQGQVKAEREKEKAEWMVMFQKMQEENTELRQMLANQGKREGGRIVDGVSLADGPRLKKELEEVGVLKPASAEEREQRKLELDRAGAEAAAQRSAETNKEILKVVNERVGALESTFDRKLDKILGIFLNEQAARMQAAGVKVPVQEVSEAEQRQAYEKLQRQVRAQQEQDARDEGEAQGS